MRKKLIIRLIKDKLIYFKINSSLYLRKYNVFTMKYSIVLFC